MVCIAFIGCDILFYFILIRNSKLGWIDSFNIRDVQITLLSTVTEV